MDLREIIWKIVDWLHLSQDRDQRLALVNSIIIFGFHKQKKNYWLAELLASEGLCSVELVS
jgi:hypothetical protein